MENKELLQELKEKIFKGEIKVDAITNGFMVYYDDGKFVVGIKIVDVGLPATSGFYRKSGS